MDIDKAILSLPAKGENTLFDKDYICTEEMSTEEIRAVAELGGVLKELRKKNISSKSFNSGIAVSMFNAKDTGLSLAFASGCDMLGLTLIEKDGRIPSGLLSETVASVSFMSDVIGIRDCDFIEKSTRYMRNFSAGIKSCVKEGVLSEKPCLINLGSDEDSPVQTISDLEHIASRFGGVDSLKGKKIGISWAYSAAGTSPVATAQGLLLLLSRFGAEIKIAYPEGYDLAPDSLKTAAANAEGSGGSVTKVDSMEEAFSGAEVVFPINWAPYAFLESRTELFSSKLGASIDLIEHELRESNDEHRDWECTEEIFEHAAEGALLMHPLPAEVSDLTCIRGEMTAQVYNARSAELFSEAGLRPYIIAAMVLLSVSEDPKAALEHIIGTEHRRHF